MSPIPSIYAHLVRVAAHSLSRARTRDNTTTSSSFSSSFSSCFSSSLDNISVGHFSLFPLRPSIHHHYHFPFTGFSFFYPSPKEGNPISIYTRGDRYDLIGRALSFLSFLSLSLSLFLPSFVLWPRHCLAEEQQSRAEHRGNDDEQEEEEKKEEEGEVVVEKEEEEDANPLVETIIFAPRRRRPRRRRRARTTRLVHGEKGSVDISFALVAPSTTFDLPDVINVVVVVVDAATAAAAASPPRCSARWIGIEIRYHSGGDHRAPMTHAERVRTNTPRSSEYVASCLERQGERERRVCALCVCVYVYVYARVCECTREKEARETGREKERREESEKPGREGGPPISLSRSRSLPLGGRLYEPSCPQDPSVPFHSAPSPSDSQPPLLLPPPPPPVSTTWYTLYTHAFTTACSCSPSLLPFRTSTRSSSFHFGTFQRRDACHALRLPGALLLSSYWGPGATTTSIMYICICVYIQSRCYFFYLYAPSSPSELFPSPFPSFGPRFP